jgi:uncharacterized membrane protein YqgA involved in biofilm formation
MYVLSGLDPLFLQMYPDLKMSIAIWIMTLIITVIGEIINCDFNVHKLIKPTKKSTKKSDGFFRTWYKSAREKICYKLVIDKQ